MFYNLPEELIWEILVFAGMDKKSNMDKVLDQFIKGGFNRKNLRLETYLKKQIWCCKIFRGWHSSERSTLRSWNYMRGGYDLLTPVSKTDWNIKVKSGSCTFIVTKCSAEDERKPYSDRIPIKSYWTRLTSKNPVTKWLKNVKKFETSYPTYANDNYLPKRKNNFNIKFKSKFYKERSALKMKKLAKANKITTKMVKVL